mmetsp:Transcript_12832/g.19860  ORF Transcript_12832/g.19860 Transcript_12832/m.19860 type:complete len:542 (+) Transcript_12832:60-1685(+)
MDTKYAVVHTAEAHAALETFVEEDIPVAAPVLVASEFSSPPPPNNQKGSEPYTDDEISITWEKGEAQPAAFRDKWFAIAFAAQFVAVSTTAMVVASTISWAELFSSTESDSTTSNNDYGGDDGVSQEQAAPGIAFWVSIIGISVLVAPALSIFSMGLMSKNAIGMITASLWFSIVLSGLVAVFSIFVAPLVGIIYGIFTICLVSYLKTVKHRIPYAASNLKCSISVLKSNLGLGLVAIGSMIGLVGYILSWAVAFMFTMSLDVMKDNTGDDNDLSPLGGFVACSFLLSFYWTHEVLRNIVRATVSGVVGHWWFVPAEAASFCSTAVMGSATRASSYSLGSIAFGSLIVAVLHLIRNTLHNARNDRNGGILRCIAACILAYIEAMVQYFNKWAYVYVGLYGYDYIESGKRVMNLFKQRGWNVIIADNLTNRLLGIMSLSIGILTGLCTLLVTFFVEEFESKQGWLGVGFFIGFVIGIVLSGIFMGLLSSAVDSVIVCFAEAPQEFNDTHPELAQEMNQTWKDAWPDVVGTVIVGLGGGLGVV